MNVNIEFFDEEPIENLVACLNYKMDKVVYFGYKKTMTEGKIQTTRESLQRICGIEDAEFYEVSEKDLYKIVSAIEKIIIRELKNGNQCFFDLTGGEDAVLVAMGVLSVKYKFPMYQYNILKDEMRVINYRETKEIIKKVEKQKIILNLDDIIRLYGGIINYNAQKNYKSFLDNREFMDDIGAMWKIASKDQKIWNGVSFIIKQCKKYEPDETVFSVKRNTIVHLIKDSKALPTIESFEKVLYQLDDAGIIRNLQITEELISFAYKDGNYKECMLDAGCILELYTYYRNKKSGKYADCRVGVHIDWDGVIKRNGMDVMNEIDVLLLEGYVPVFISCKNGKINQMPLYELDAVANRFGGKYVKKQLAITQPTSRAHLNRAKEMGIEVIKMR